MDKILIKVLLVVSLAVLISSLLPPQVKVCPRNHSQLPGCFKNFVMSLRPFLKSGNIAPGLSIRPLDPVYLGNLTFTEGVDLKLYSVTGFGVCSFIVENIRMNLEPLQIEAVISISELLVSMQYALNYGLWSANGDAFVTMENVKLVIKMKGKKYSKGRTEYLTVDDAAVQIKEANHPKVRLENGQMVKEFILNIFIRKHLNSAMRKILSGEQYRFVDARDYMNSFFDKVSYAELFPQK